MRTQHGSLVSLWIRLIRLILVTDTRIGRVSVPSETGNLEPRETAQIPVRKRDLPFRCKQEPYTLVKARKGLSEGSLKSTGEYGGWQVKGKPTSHSFQNEFTMQSS